MMNERLLYIGEEHISASASPQDAKRVADLLRAEGWMVAYGDRPWQFEYDKQRVAFEAAFQWATAVVAAEKQNQGDESLISLVKQRCQLNERLRAYEAVLLENRPEWVRYYQWLLETPADVILTWVAGIKKDVPKA